MSGKSKEGGILTKFIAELKCEKGLKGIVYECDKCAAEGEAGMHTEDEMFYEHETEKLFCNTSGKRMYDPEGDDESDGNDGDEFRLPPPSAWQRIQALRAYAKSLEKQLRERKAA